MEDKVNVAIPQEDYNENTVNHTEVVIGLEQGTMFPTKVGTTLCNVLIDTGAKVKVLKFLVYSVLEPAVGYLTTLHFNSQQGTHPTLV